VDTEDAFAGDILQTGLAALPEAMHPNLNCGIIEDANSERLLLCAFDF
jgi:hypothetical protein